MIDDDDATWFALLAPTPTTFIGALILIALLVCIAIAAHSNESECAARHCANGGKPMIVKHECVCIAGAE